MASLGYKSTDKMMLKSEAEKIMENEVRNKEFWAVYNDFDNCVKLQKVIDVLYNSIVGNDYEVHFQENQNGTRLTIHCNVCSKELSSYDPFITHENGKPHKKIRQQKMTPKDPNLCTKLQRRPHNETRGIFPKGSLEDQIDSTHHTVLGIQFVYKENVRGKELFTCQLCLKSAEMTRRIKASQMFSHLIGKAHNRKYLEVKFGMTKDRSWDFEEEAERIEQHEGKIHQMIIDFTSQLPFELRDDLKGRSPSPSSRERKRAHSHSRSPVRSPSRRSRTRSVSSGSSSPVNIDEPGTSGVKPKTKSTETHEEDKLLTPLPPPPPPKINTQDIEVACNMSKTPKPILEDMKLLQQIECKDMLLEDIDMQACLVQTLWTLNLKLDKYYSRRADKQAHRMIEATSKLKEYIQLLNVMTPDTN